MTSEQFRRLALSLPETAEGQHMNHPDFRVRGRIFATIMPPDGACGMVKLTPQQQREFVAADPVAFRPVKGGWGRRGCTQVLLKCIGRATLRRALLTAWCNAAPARLVKDLGVNDGT
jgi:hypothetical protein